MLKYSKLAGIAAAIVLSLMWAVPAQAQATRTWISGVGDDVNPCSRTAPCKTFPGAISKTAAGGEIDCLDPGGFGGVTVTKSITLDCGGGVGGQVGSILVSGTNGVTANCVSSCIVKVRNLTINGIQATGSPGLSGIRVLSNVSALIVEHVGIFGMGGTAGSNGGIDFEPSIASKLMTRDVEVQYGLADGILIKPQSTGSAIAVIYTTSAMGNNGSGVRVDNTNLASGTITQVTINNSDLSGNAAGVNTTTPAGTIAANTVVTNSVLSGNSIVGLLASGANATVVVGGSTVSGNATGLVAGGGGKVLTYSDNYFYNGTTGTSNGTPSGTVTKL
jgi:hypothetical protein